MASPWTRDQLLHYGWQRYPAHTIEGVLHGNNQTTFTDTEIAAAIAAWFQVPVAQVTNPTTPPPTPPPEAPIPLAIVPSDWQEGDVATFHNGKWQALPGGTGGGPVNVYIQAAQPTSPVTPSLWIPLDASGNPLPPNQWQVFA